MYRQNLPRSRANQSDSAIRAWTPRPKPAGVLGFCKQLPAVFAIDTANFAVAILSGRGRIAITCKAVVQNTSQERGAAPKATLARKASAMADMFTLTPQPVRVTATGFQPIYLVLDVGAYDFFDAQLGILNLEGTASPNATIELWTGMQNQTDDGYVQLFAWGNQNTTNTWIRQGGISGMLRYLRWKVTALGGTTPAVTFSIRGMMRAYK